MTKNEYHLRVYLNRSELWLGDEMAEEFSEGAVSVEAKKRYKAIADELKNGYLTKFIALCKNSPSAFSFGSIDVGTRKQLEAIANSMTSEKGRALVHILVLQLTVKAIQPNQTIRLHKANAQSAKFGWVEGLSMRSLDANFITPALREANLSKVNRDGAFMTRSFAENYPYSKVYKAGILGARDEWLTLVDKIEEGLFDPLEGLAVVLFRLINLADEFERLADEVLLLLERLVDEGKFQDIASAERLLLAQMETSDYSARVMEVVMHTMMQAVEELNGLAGLDLNPLTQMRSANLKHSNFGDIELTLSGDVAAAWDAKYAKANLREELEEMDTKFSSNSPPEVFGFVTSVPPELTPQIQERISELSAQHSVAISITHIDTWISEQVGSSLALGIKEEDLAKHWVRAFAESLAQRRRLKAPIDEPCFEWLKNLRGLLAQL